MFSGTVPPRGLDQQTETIIQNSAGLVLVLITGRASAWSALPSILVRAGYRSPDDFMKHFARRDSPQYGEAVRTAEMICRLAMEKFPVVTGLGRYLGPDAVYRLAFENGVWYDKGAIPGDKIEIQLA